MHTQSKWVKQRNGIGDLDAEDEWAKSTEITGRLGAEGNQVLTADGANLDREGVLVVIDKTLCVVRDKLLGRVGLNGRNGAKEINKAGSMRARAEEEVEAAGR